MAAHFQAELRDCKGALHCEDEFVVGDGAEAVQAFVRIRIALLAARTDAQKAMLLEGQIQLLEQDLEE